MKKILKNLLQITTVLIILLCSITLLAFNTNNELTTSYSNVPAEIMNSDDFDNNKNKATIEKLEKSSEYINKVISGEEKGWLEDFVLDNKFGKEVDPLNPIVKNTFHFSYVDAHSAEFRFIYLTPAWNNIHENILGLKLLDFYSRNDLVLIWDKNDNQKVTEDEVFEITNPVTKPEPYSSSSKKKVGIEWVAEEEIVVYNKQIINVPTYRVTGLKSSTDYENFSLYIKPDNGELPWIIDDGEKVLDIWEVDPESGELVPTVNFVGWYSDENDVRFTTHYDPTVLYVIIVILLFIIILGIAAALAVKWLIWWKKNMNLAIFFDAKSSYAEGEVVLNLVHVDRNPTLWEAHESDLTLFAAGRRIEALFRRDESIINGYKLYITEKTKSKRVVMSLITASRYDRFYIGLKGSAEKFHATMLTDEKAEKLVGEGTKTDKERYREAREMMIREIDQRHEKVTKDNVHVEGKKHNIISAISDKKSKATSLRYQLLFPVADNSYKDFDPESKEIKFYHVYNGRLYRMDHKFVGKYGSMYEFDLINLQPGTIYVGISTTIYCEKNHVLPSASIYGITKNEDKTIPNKTEAILGRPADENVESIEIWKIEEAIENLGKEQFYRMFETITKKHYEDENEDAYMPTLRAREFHDDYIFKWLRETHRDVDIKKVEETYGLHEHDKDLKKRKNDFYN